MERRRAYPKGLDLEDMAKARWRFDIPSSLLTLVVAGIAAFGVRAYRHQPAKPRTAHERIAVDLDRIQGLKAGYVGHLSDPIHGVVTVGKTREDYEAMAEAEDTGDEMGLQEIVSSGRGYRIHSGNDAELVAKNPLGEVKLKIAGGDYADEDVWTSGEYFH